MQIAAYFKHPSESLTRIYLLDEHKVVAIVADKHSVTERMCNTRIYTEQDISLLEILMYFKYFLE